MFLLNEQVGLWVWPSQVTASVITVLVNFWVMKWLVFDR